MEIFLYSYENIEFRNPFISLRLIVWALFAGFVIAAIMALYNKRVIGSFVKDILAQGCTSEKDAKTVIDLGYGTDWFIKNALRTDTVLRRLVVRIDAATESNQDADAEKVESAESSTKKQKSRSPKHEVIDFSTAKFYIPEELKYRAEVRYASRGTDVVTFFIGVVVLAAAAFAALFVVPELIQLLDNFIGTLR